MKQILQERKNKLTLASLRCINLVPKNKTSKCKSYSLVEINSVIIYNENEHVR